MHHMLLHTYVKYFQFQTFVSDTKCFYVHINYNKRNYNCLSHTHTARKTSSHIEYKISTDPKIQPSSRNRQNSGTTGVSRLSLNAATELKTVQLQCLMTQDICKWNVWIFYFRSICFSSADGALANNGNVMRSIVCRRLTSGWWWSTNISLGSQFAGYGVKWTVFWLFVCFLLKNKQHPNDVIEPTSPWQPKTTTTPNKDRAWEEGFLLLFHCNKTLLPLARVSMATRMENRCDVWIKKQSLYEEKFKRSLNKNHVCRFQFLVCCVNKTLHHCSQEKLKQGLDYQVEESSLSLPQSVLCPCQALLRPFSDSQKGPNASFTGEEGEGAIYL